jgi:hypothetical protein
MGALIAFLVLVGSWGLLGDAVNLLEPEKSILKHALDRSSITPVSGWFTWLTEKMHTPKALVGALVLFGAIDGSIFYHYHVAEEEDVPAASLTDTAASSSVTPPANADEGEPARAQPEENDPRPDSADPEQRVSTNLREIELVVVNDPGTYAPPPSSATSADYLAPVVAEEEPTAALPTGAPEVNYYPPDPSYELDPLYGAEGFAYE